VKNNLIIDIEEHLVRYLSQTWAGRIHDKRICDEEDYTFPPLKIQASKGLNLRTSLPINRRKSPESKNSVLKIKPRIR
jgi:hypothetical protein